jgi:surfactin synthase thioesterase subunit
VQELADQVAAEIRGLVGQEDEVWAVTHSMGGIILRHIQALPDRGVFARTSHACKHVRCHTGRADH